MGTTLSVTVSSQLDTELSQAGVWAYAVVCYAGQTTLSSTDWTTLVANGVVQGTGGTENITLPSSLTGGKVYFIIQSQTPSPTPEDLTTDLTTQSMINPGSAATYDFAYDSVEVTLSGTSYDVANLTSVNGFAIPMVTGAKVRGDGDFWAFPDAGAYDSFGTCRCLAICPVCPTPSW